VVVRRDGTVSWVDGDDLGLAREPESSSPSVLPVASGGYGDVNCFSEVGSEPGHRTRLALGIDRDGKLLLALTRLDLPLPAADRIPFGLTLPEMAAVMGALGARQAVSLDGGISAQLMLRDAEGEAHRWPGLRRVPLALLATPRR
jgi:hypothetical protein